MPIRKVGTIGTVGTVPAIRAAGVRAGTERPYSQLKGPPIPGKQAVRPLNRFLARAVQKQEQAASNHCDDVNSSAIAAVDYNSAQNRLFVTFNSGRRYGYFDVSQSQYQAFCEADSKGRFFNKNIRDKYAYARMG